MFRSVFSTSPSSFRNKEKGGKRSNNRYTVSNYWTWRTRRKRKGGRKKNGKIEKKKARRRQSRQMEDEVTLCTSKETVDLSRNVFIKEENRHKCRSTSLQVVAIMLEHSCAFLKMLEIEGTKWKEGRSGRVWGTSIKFIFVPREKKKKKRKRSCLSLDTIFVEACIYSQSRPAEFQVSVSKRREKWPIFFNRIG